MKTIIEPFRIKSVEPFRVTTVAQREAALRSAGFNVFQLRAEDVMIDLLTDSGTGAMSTRQWAALMAGDESYAGSASFFELEKVVRDLTGYRHVFPVHQGRAAERILFTLLVREGQVIPNNAHFDTTRANIEYLGGVAVDLPCAASADLGRPVPFKGDMDFDGLARLFEAHPAADIPFGMMTITNNRCGGQPVSMANLRSVSAAYRARGIPFFLDAARFAENAWLIQQNEESEKGRTLPELARGMFELADGCLISAKKDGLVNIGGILAVQDDSLAARIRELLILTEGFPTYGGLAGRDLAALAQGLCEVLDADYLSYRAASARYFADHLDGLGVPIVRPCGLHAVYVDARALLPHIPPEQFPGQALVCELYRTGGIRAVEIGTLMFGRVDPRTGEDIAADVDLVRLCLPRRVYTQSHVDWVIEVFGDLMRRKDELRGFRILEQPRFLRAFTARLAPVG
ncbi:MAG: tryptophanase [Planctomycetota bacterium]